MRQTLGMERPVPVQFYDGRQAVHIRLESCGPPIRLVKSLRSSYHRKGRKSTEALHRAQVGRSRLQDCLCGGASPRFARASLARGSARKGLPYRTANPLPYPMSFTAAPTRISALTPRMRM